MAENTIIHEIHLAGYKATSTGGMLDLGTWGSYGIEKLHLTLDAAWQDLTITAFFNVNGKVVAKRVVGKDGYADVPWEATKENTFAGCLAFEGSINGQRRISTNLNYKVTNHSETTDSDPVPTDDRWNQFVTETKEYRDGAFEAAKKANARAEDAETASEDAQAAARAAKASENAAAASASNAAADAGKAGPYAKAAQAAQEAAENAAAAAAASKSAADTLAAEAARAALAAENSKTAAKAAQNAQTATAAAKAEAVKAQGVAQTAAKSAQDAQAAAENVRDDAQTAQKGAEAARDAAAKSAEAAAKSEANAKQSADTLAESVKNITPDDSAIGDKPWSSKHIIDMLCPPLEESDNPVVCYPVAGYPLGVKANWEPAQEGTGTPSPENIRPIKGRDSVTVERCGENLLNPELNVYNTYTPYGLTITYIGDNKVHLKGTYTPEGGGDFFVILDSNQKLLAGRNLKITGFTIEGTKQTYRLYGLRTKDETAIAMNADFNYGDVIDMTVAIVVSRETPTTYVPYTTGQTNTLTLPKTVYGGEVDAVTGEGQETRKLVTLDGTEKWYTWGVNANNPAVTGFYTYDINDYSNDMGDGDKILCSTVLRTTGDIWGGKNVGIGFADSGGSKYLIYCMKTDTLSDTTNDKEAITSFKTFLADLYTAGTPVQVAYVLNEPVPFTATGAQPLIALAGANTVLTDADSATVTGRADPIKRIEDLEAAVASIN